jgi:hypothetical protein
MHHQLSNQTHISFDATMTRTVDTASLSRPLWSSG